LKDVLKSQLDEKDRMRMKKLLMAAQTLDLCFVFDATYSMDNAFKAVHAELRNIIAELQKDMMGLRFQLAVVAYRDVDCDAHVGRITKVEFTGSISTIEKALADMPVKGGGDLAEDVVSGLAAANSLEWKMVNRILVLCGDAPHHGTDYHDYDMSIGASYDDYPSGVFPGSQPSAPILKELHQKKVQIIFLKLKDSTDKMIRKFNEEIGAGEYIKTFNLGIDIEGSSLGAISSSIKTTVKDSITKSTTASAAGVSSKDESGAKRVSMLKKRLTLIAEEFEPPPPLPEEWESAIDQEGYVYYWNKATDETTYTHPVTGAMATDPVTLE